MAASSRHGGKIRDPGAHIFICTFKTEREKSKWRKNINTKSDLPLINLSDKDGPLKSFTASSNSARNMSPCGELSFTPQYTYRNTSAELWFQFFLVFISLWLSFYIADLPQP